MLNFAFFFYFKECVDVEVDVEPSPNNATPQPTIVSLVASPQANTGPQASTGPQANTGSPLPTASDPNITPRDPPLATGSEPPLQPTVISSCSPESTLVPQTDGPPNVNCFPFGLAEPPVIRVSSEDPPSRLPSLPESHSSGTTNPTCMLITIYKSYFIVGESSNKSERLIFSLETSTHGKFIISFAWMDFYFFTFQLKKT